MLYVRTSFFFTVSPKDPAIEYTWFDVGMLDYDDTKKLYLVQKVNAQNRIVDAKGKPIVNGGLKKNGIKIS